MNQIEKDLPAKIITKGKNEIKNYQLAVVKQMVQLSTAGFGLVAALAWNDLIRTLLNDYIKPKLGAGANILSMAIYAIIITALAVFITLQLGRIAAKLEHRN